MTAPVVSVVMATYNGERFVAETIASVLDQTYGELELVVVDDNSSDATSEIVASLAERDAGRVRLVRKGVREGPCRARNEALSLTRGSLICWMDQDDLWTPTKVEQQVRVLQSHQQVGLVYSYFDAFESESDETLYWPDGRRDIEGDVLDELVLTGCFIGSITTMFRREALDRSGGRLRERDFSIGDDYYLWLSIALDWKVLRIPAVLAHYRRHSSNESRRISREIDIDLWRSALLVEFLGAFPEASRRLSRQTRAGLRRRLFSAALREFARGHVLQGRTNTAAARKLWQQEPASPVARLHRSLKH